MEEERTAGSDPRIRYSDTYGAHLFFYRLERKRQNLIAWASLVQHCPYTVTMEKLGDKCKVVFA